MVHKTYALWYIDLRRKSINLGYRGLPITIHCIFDNGIQDCSWSSHSPELPSVPLTAVEKGDGWTLPFFDCCLSPLPSLSPPPSTAARLPGQPSLWRAVTMRLSRLLELPMAQGRSGVEHAHGQIGKIVGCDRVKGERTATMTQFVKP